MNVNVSAYNDAHLLDGALASVRDILPEATITVTDGKYSTFRPDAPPNSTDDTAAVADRYGAHYGGAGPFDRERDKHVHRVESSPDGERLLLMDADERLHAYDADALDAGTSYSPRIANVLVYGPASKYWPRLCDPATVLTINRWDAYLFDVPHERTDAVTLIHRHDLRDRTYRQAKYDRFRREDRIGRYAEDFDTYLDDEWDAAFDRCPACGHQSVTHSQWTDFGSAGFTRVAVCTAGDGCYAATESLTVDTWRYLPDDWSRGFADDPERLRVELVDAGCTFVRPVTAGYMARQMRPAVELWVGERFGEREPDVFAGEGL